LLNRALDVVELVQDGFAEGRGPVELIVHAGDDLRIVQQADDARVPAGIRLHLGLLGQLAQEPVGRDDIDRERRALQDQDQQRIGIERDRGDQNVELLRRKQIRPGRDLVGRWLLGCRFRRLRRGLGQRVGRGRLLRLQFDVRVADANQHCPGGHRQPPTNRLLPPSHRCPPFGQRFVRL